MITLKINDRIRNRKVEFFQSFQLSLRFDSVASTFSFNGVYNPKNPEHKEMFCVGHDHIAMVDYKGKRILTGYIMQQGFQDSREKQLSSFAGYSLPGFLEDCNISPDHYPLQMDGLTLLEIAQKLVKPFGISVVVDPAVSSLMNSAIDKATPEPTETVKAFLTKLASAKNILITHDESGRLLFTRARTRQIPILDFNTETQSTIPFTTMNLQFSGQAMHSEIHVLKEADEDEGSNAGQSVIKNPYVPFVYRPRVITQSSGDDIDTETAARNALSSELRNLRLVIDTDRWEDGNGDLIVPNRLITVLNPEIYLFKKTTWFVEQVDFVGNQQELTTRLTCCVPEVYNGQIPQYIWKGINLH